MAEKEDFLTEDPDIPGQKVCLLSFLSPEKVLANKDVFLFSKFLETFEFTVLKANYESFLMGKLKAVNDKINEDADKAENADLSGVALTLRSSRVRIDTVMTDLQAHFKANQSEMKATKVKEMYDEFIASSREKLEQEFYALNDFRTTVRGVKIRGVYNSKEEAVARSKKLQRSDTIHNIFLGEIGKWLPWDPAPSEVGEQEYAEEELNTLMKKYKENEDAREQYERENRSRMSKKGDAPLAPTSLEVVSESTTNTDNIHSMFSDSSMGDLAIQRKMNKDV